MNRVWQEQLDKAGANPRDDYLISSSGLAAQLGEAGVKVLDATTHLRPTEDGGFSSEPGFDDFLSEHIPGAQFADLQGALSDAESSFRFTVPSAGQFARSVGDLGITASDEVVIYSSTHPMWATRMWWLFRVFGHKPLSCWMGGSPPGRRRVLLLKQEKVTWFRLNMVSPFVRTIGLSMVRRSLRDKQREGSA